jgi:Zn-dependent peptidase ImmA (M78 family)
MKQVARSLPTTDPRAQALRDRFHARFAADELPVPVEEIAEDLLGLHVEEAEIDCSGLLLPSERLVVLRAGEPRVRQRFTLAHELGHWVCQVREGHDAPVFCRAADLAPGADRLREREANVFAAELLMPEPAVRVEWPRAASATELAGWFGVSEEAMRWRLYSFELVEERPT